MNITSTTATQHVGAATALAAPEQASVVKGMMDSLAGALDNAGIDSETRGNFLDVAGSLKHTGSALWTARTAVGAFQQWMNGEDTLSSQAMLVLAHGMNALALGDAAVGGLAGLASYAQTSGSIVNAAKVVNGIEQGNMSQVLFSGAKLCVTLAASGSPVAMGVLTAAEFLYNQQYGGQNADGVRA